MNNKSLSLFSKLFTLTALSVTISATLMAQINNTPQPGEPDLTFGEQGLLQTDFFNRDYLVDAMLDLEGHIVMVDPSANMVSYHQDGSINQAFADNEIKNLRQRSVNSALVDHQGRLLHFGNETIQGSSAPIPGPGLIHRFTANGEVDTTFGEQGKTKITITIDSCPMDTVLKSATIDNNGKILVVGSGCSGVLVFRLLENGQLDDTFAGISTKGFSIYSSFTISTDSQDNIYISSDQGALELEKFDSHGVPVEDFGDNGVASLQTAATYTDIGGQHAINSQGDIFLLGQRMSYLDQGESFDLAVVKYHANGQLDEDFGNRFGIAVPFSDFTDKGINILIDSNDRILSSGYRDDAEGKRTLLLTRFHPDGSLDLSFGQQGHLNYDSVHSAWPKALLMDDAGYAYLASSIGVPEDESYSNLALVKVYSGAPALQRQGHHSALVEDLPSDAITLFDLHLPDEVKTALSSITLTALPTDGQLFLDLNDNGSLDGEIETLTVGSDISKAQLTASLLKFLPGTSLTGHLAYTVNDDNGSHKLRLVVNPAPTATFSASQSHYIPEQPVTLTISFDEMISGFDADDLNLSNATLASFTSNESGYEVQLTANEIGPDIVIELAENAAIDFRGVASKAASWSFAMGNVAPIITGIPATTINQDNRYQFSPIARDLNNHDLLFSIKNQPLWADFDTTTGMLSGTPTNADVGITGAIIISVSDGNLTTALFPFNLKVVNINDAPTLSGIPEVAVSEGAQYRFMPQAADQDIGDTLTFSIENQPSWTDFDVTTGALTGTPSGQDAGLHSDIIISVSDSGGAVAALPAFAIQVNALDIVTPPVTTPPSSGSSGGSIPITLAGLFLLALGRRKQK
ncbi:MAG: putative delta-60 repeat protein [Phenylobacterium sp.]|jgi:uncharacterized delta-60 repeat protein